MKHSLYLFILLLLPLSSFCQSFRVAVAANAQFAAEALKKAFEKRSTDKIELIVSSSGKLTAQIEHGAPYAVFLSADMKYPESLYQRGFAIDNPVVYASGKLVLWTLTPQHKGGGMGRLLERGVKTIALANPATAPYGVAAVQALQKAGIYQEIQDKIVYGQSISQVNQYLLAGVADMAFTAKSVVKAPDLKNRGSWVEINDSLYTPIRQGAVILKYASGEALQGARRFFTFLFSPEARKILKAYGYQVNE